MNVPLKQFWLWPNLLGLDAPIIALVWQTFLAQCFSIPLRLSARCALALTVWIIYLTDRLLDTHTSHLHEASRHRFHREWKRPLIILLVILLILDMGIAVFWLRPAVFHNGLFALAGVIAYFGFLHFRGVALPKELLVAGLFTTGVFLTGLTNTESRYQLIFPALAFFTLCAENLFIIEHWEQAAFHQKATPFVPAPKVVAGILLVLICAALFFRSEWYIAIGISALFKLILVIREKKLEYDLRRVLIDAALLTPIFFFP